MIRTSASETSPAAADWPIARPSPKLWRPIPVAIRSASRRAGREALDPRARARTRRPPRRPGPTSGVARRRLQPAVVVDEAHQADREAAASSARAAGEAAPACAPRAAASTGSTPCERTSQSRKTRIPVANAVSAARSPASCSPTRPSGRPRKIVKPAIAPRTRVCVGAHLVRVTLQTSRAGLPSR